MIPCCGLIRLFSAPTGAFGNSLGREPVGPKERRVPSFRFFLVVLSPRRGRLSGRVFGSIAPCGGSRNEKGRGRRARFHGLAPEAITSRPPCGLCNAATVSKKTVSDLTNKLVRGRITASARAAARRSRRRDLQVADRPWSRGSYHPLSPESIRRKRSPPNALSCKWLWRRRTLFSLSPDGPFFSCASEPRIFRGLLR